MTIQTAILGEIEIDESLIINFPRGLLGFPDNKRFVLLTLEAGAAVFIMQSVDDPKLRFAVTDIFKNYDPKLSPEKTNIVICNFVNGWMTANLLGPVVIDETRKTAKQIVFKGSRYSTRHPVCFKADWKTSLQNYLNN